MIKIKVKIFEVGKWNKTEFSKEKIKELISNTPSKIKAIFAHTSKYKEEEEPLEVGEFEKIKLEGNIVTANLKLNPKGKEYKKDGIIKGISAEITNAFDRIALLPRGVKPAVSGAEFEEIEVLEFEEMEEKMNLNELIKDLTLEQKLELLKLIGQSVTQDQKKAIRLIGYEFAEIEKEMQEKLDSGKEFELVEKVVPVTKTEEDIRKEARAEFEREKEAEELVAKLTPALQVIAKPLALEFAKKPLIMEFEQKETNSFELFKNLVNGIKVPDRDITNSLEFEARGQEGIERKKELEALKKTFGGNR